MTYDELTNDKKIEFLKQKIEEYQKLGDIDAVEYYQANLNRLESSIKSSPVSNIENLYSNFIKAVKSFNYNATVEEKKKVIGTIFYYMGYLVDSLKTENEVINILLRVSNDLNSNKFESSIQKDFFDDITKKFNNFKNQSMESENNFEKTISNVQNQINNIKNKYRSLFTGNGMSIEDVEELLVGTNNLINYTNSLKSIAKSQDELVSVNKTISELMSMKSNMNDVINSLKKMDESFSR